MSAMVTAPICRLSDNKSMKSERYDFLEQSSNASSTKNVIFIK